MKIKYISHLIAVPVSIIAILISLYVWNISQQPIESKSTFPQIPKKAIMVGEDIYRVDSYSMKYGNVHGYIYVSKTNKKKAYLEREKKRSHLPCSSPILNRGRWRTSENCLIDTTNNQNLTSEFIKTSVETAKNRWNSHISLNVLGNSTFGVSDGIDLIFPDGKNEILFGFIPSSSIIAMTVIWYKTEGFGFGTPTIIETDIILNHDDFLWGNATKDPTKMDLLNILMHEFGHAFGLDDQFNNICENTTMSGFSTEGETKKRSLHQQDIAGAIELYSNGNIMKFSWIVIIFIILLNF